MAHLRTTEPDQQQHRSAKYDAWRSLPDTEPDPFKDLIQRDPVVCDNCFLRRYEIVSFEWWRGTFGWMNFRHWFPIPGRHYPVYADDVDRNETAGTRLACGNCGHRTTKDRPVPKDEIPRIIENLSETLTEKGIDHDADVLALEVESRNTCENQCRQDSHVFGPAVRDAIQSADSNWRRSPQVQTGGDRR